MPIDPSKVQWDAIDPAAVKWDDAPAGKSLAQPRPKWSDLPGNILPSAKQFAGGIVDAVTSPVQTVQGLADLAAGGLRNAVPAPVRQFIDRLDPNQQAAQRASDTASAVGQHYAGRYGSLEGARNALITDPVGVAGDMSTLLGGGAGLASKVGMAKTANALSTASTATNPLSAVAPVVRGAAKVAGTVARPVLGLTTGVGGEAVGEAFRSGVAGKTDFVQNMRGNVPVTDVLDRAKQGLQNMVQAKAAEYRSGMVPIKGDKTVLSLQGIDQALQDASALTTFKGQVKNSAANDAVTRMRAAVEEWRGLDPKEFHTPEGLDALKQKLGGIMEGIPFEEKTARLAAGKVYSAAKSSIEQQAPAYANVMKDYSAAAELIGEIERTLSLKPNASVDTSMRKLQSLMRNNVQTNYSGRTSLARDLEQRGGVDLMPSIAGQAMNSLAPRSLAGQIGGGTAGLMAIQNPAFAAALPIQSPRLVGEAAYGAGRAAGGIGNAFGRTGLTIDDLAAYGLAANQLTNLQGRR